MFFKSLAFRAVLAIVLMFGFYFLSIAVAALLLYIPYAEWVYANRLHFKIAVFCVGGAAIILWSLIPRFDKFVKPGPRLDSTACPELFTHIRDIAEKTDQKMPEEVYLVSDVNAWVSQRGGFMGIGSRRVMGLGLPLLQILSISELRAVLAHEFGHFYGGDTKLAPWVYKTRSAIVRTLQGLAEHSSILQKPFLAYGKMFLRVTHAVSRAQEYTADRLAADTVGAKYLIRGLSMVHGASSVFEHYWQNEVVPILNLGFKPMIAEGFEHFIHAQPIASAIAEMMQEELNHAKDNSYDTHPAFKDRIEALKRLPQQTEIENNQRAITLLSSVAGLEIQLLTCMAGDKLVDSLKPVDWREVGQQVYLPCWESMVSKRADALEGVSFTSLPGIAWEPSDMGQKLAKVIGKVLDTEGEIQVVQSTIGAAVAITLYRKGWSLEVRPGYEIELILGNRSIKPFQILSDLAAGKMDAQTWKQQCQEANIDVMNLDGIQNMEQYV